jgi:acetate---CoA ligase (ADP-forming)
LAAIHKMLHPRSVAVVGATPRQQYGGRFLTAVLRARDRVRVYPVNPNYAEKVRGARLLQGFRGRPPADVDALAQTLVNVSYMAVHLDGAMAELDINPLIVLHAGAGLKAADALVILSGLDA